MSEHTDEHTVTLHITDPGNHTDEEVTWLVLKALWDHVYTSDMYIEAGSPVEALRQINCTTGPRSPQNERAIKLRRRARTLDPTTGIVHYPGTES